MSKAVLVMDMPECCHECILREGFKCNVTGYLHYGNERPVRCPLQEVPEKKIVFNASGAEGAFLEGWNACIAEMLNEREVR